MQFNQILSMSKRDDKLLLSDIKESCEKILRYVGKISFETFKNDDKTKDAVVRNFEIIGEASNRLSSSIKGDYSSLVEWRRIVGFRNRIVHEYFGVDYEILWSIIKNQIPELQTNIEFILNELK